MAEDLNEESLMRAIEEAAKEGPLSINPTCWYKDATPVSRDFPWTVRKVSKEDLQRAVVEARLIPRRS